MNDAGSEMSGAEIPRQSGPPSEPIRVLIADDHVLFRRGLEMVLGQEPDIEVVGEAADGEEAVAKAADLLPDVVLLDVRMPRMSGIEVCRELRAGPLTADVPIILLTARARPQDLEQGYAAGANDYVVKPFSPRELLERVESALARVAG